jgi:hypothetical protein
MRDRNPFIKGSVQTPFLPELSEGAEVYGLMDGVDSRSRKITPLLGGVPDGMAATLLRIPGGVAGYGERIEDFDLLILLNLTADPLLNPMLGIDPSGLDPDFARALQLRGPDRNPFFFGDGAELLPELGSYSIFATLIPADGTIFNVGFNGGFSGGIELFAGQPVFFIPSGVVFVPEGSSSLSGVMLVLVSVAGALTTFRRLASGRGRG